MLSAYYGTRVNNVESSCTKINQMVSFCVVYLFDYYTILGMYVVPSAIV